MESVTRKEYRGYRFAKNEPVVEIAASALARCGHEVRYGLSGGAADANVFNERGLECVNLANGMTDIHTPNEHISVADLETMVDVTPEVKVRIAALWSMANIVTLTGLLGTVTGLIKTFHAIGGASPSERQVQLSNGISEAMYNTAFGLSIALVCMLGHLLLSASMKKVVSDLEAFSMRFENLLADGAAGAATATASRAPAAPTEDLE